MSIVSVDDSVDESVDAAIAPCPSRSRRSASAKTSPNPERRRGDPRCGRCGRRGRPARRRPAAPHAEIVAPASRRRPGRGDPARGGHGRGPPSNLATTRAVRPPCVDAPAHGRDRPRRGSPFAIRIRSARPAGWTACRVAGVEVITGGTGPRKPPTGCGFWLFAVRPRSTVRDSGSTRRRWTAGARPPTGPASGSPPSSRGADVHELRGTVDAIIAGRRNRDGRRRAT